MKSEMFGVVFRGSIRIPAEGEYSFALGSDDGSRLFIDGKIVVVNDSIHGMIEKTGSVRLGEGKHPILIEFFDNHWNEALSLSIQGPALPTQPVPLAFLFRR